MMNKEERSALFSALSAVVRDYVDKAKQELTKWVSGEFKALTDLIDERFRSLPVPERGITKEDLKPYDDAAALATRDIGRLDDAHVRLAEALNQLEEAWKSQPKPKDGEDGKDADPEMVRAAVKQELSKVNIKIEPSEMQLRDEIMPRLMALFEQNSRGVAEVIASYVPKPKDGEPGKPAEPVDMDAVQRMIETQVALAVGALPKPTDGKDADLNEVKAFITSEVSRSVNALPKPNDGLPGKDGAPGKDGESIHPDTIALMVAKEVRAALAELPKPKDGVDGRDGRDALSLDPLEDFDPDKEYPAGTWASHNGGMWRCLGGTRWKCTHDAVYDVDESHDGERTITTTYRWASGKEKQFTRNTKEMKQRGIWQEGREYAWGDVVTRGGSQWYCQVEKTTAGPKEHDCHDWVLIVQRGRDGKSAPFNAQDFKPGPIGLK